MAFSFGNASNALTGASQGSGSGTTAGAVGSTTQGPDLELIQTENLGFLSLAGDAKVQLTAKWTDSPAPTASLISIASRKGLVAAAGPDAVHIATTESVRKAFEAAKAGDSEVRPFEPQAKLPLPMRISQLAFTFDEQYLIISAETGGGLAVYDVQSVSQGSTQPAMEISTNGESLRTLLPNPNPDMAELVLAVTNNGNLLVANLKQRGLVSGPSGPVMKAGVSSAAWSTKGKQLVAGLADGTLEQLTPDGTSKANIPKPSGVDNHHVASVAWLENNVFLVVHNVTNGDGPPSTYHVITRHQEKGSPASYVFQKLTDPVEPFGSEKKPHHTLLRLKDFPPDLQDVLLVSSTCREAIGLLTRSKTPLTSSVAADKITNVFTTTEFADDSKRAELPMGEDYMDTFPIGTALDLSSKDKVYKPIPTDEMDESPGPLPGLWALNNEGVLSVWWIVYNDSIRQGTTYPGMAAAQSTGAASAAPTAPVATPFASTSTTSAFGAASTPAPSFGGSSMLGAKQSPWGTPAAATPTAPAFGNTAFGSGGGNTAKSTFGSPAFGSTSTPGGASSTPAFGQSSVIGGGMGPKPSPWATGGTTSGATPAFGTPGLGSAGSGGTGKIFGGGNTSTPVSGGGFSSFANKGGFGSLASGGVDNNNGGSIFGSGKPSASFASTSQNTSLSQATSFPPPAAKTGTGSAPFGSSPFVLGTTFKPDPKTANENEKPTASGGGSLFGSGFGLTLGDTAKTPEVVESKDADMEAETPAAVEKPSSVFAPGSSVFGAPTLSGAQGDKPNPFGASSEQAKPLIPAAAEKPNPFAGPGNKSNLFSSGTSSIFGSTKKAEEPATSIFAKPDTTPASEKKNPFGTFGASTTPSTSPAPSKLFSNTTSTGGIFGNSKSTLGGTGSIFGAPTQTSSPFSSLKKADGAPSTPDKKAAEASLPLPPESTSKATFTLSESSGSSAASPRIPEHMPSSHPLREVTDFTSLPVESSNSERSATPDDAPLPPDPVKEKSKYNMADLKLPPGVVSADDKQRSLTSGSKTSGSVLKFSDQDEGATEQPVPSSDDEGELTDEEQDVPQSADEDERGSAPDSEGSGVDVTKDLSPPGYTPQSSFGGAGGGIFSHTPADEPRPGSRLLFGEMSRNAPLFPQPVATSPRSPSPVRGAVPPRVVRSDSVRSVSAPGMASSILGRSKANFGISGMSRQQPGRHTPDPNVEEQRRSQARREADEAQVLYDHEDDWKQDLLNAPPQPTLELAEFTPNTGSAPEAGRTVPAQAEAMYRDINRMVDTLGLNARHLKEYILGHMGKLRAPGTPHKTGEDLEIPDDWILCDAEDVGTMLDEELRVELEDGRVKNADEVLEACQELSRGLARLRIKEMDIKKTIISRIDPSQADALRSLPLSAEQAAQQGDLRKQFTSFCKLLAEAEESLTMLRAKMATAGGLDGRRNGSVGGAGSGANAVPTVDAVLRTIMKMTSMAEKRSGDVDVLENQLRKLRLQQGLGAANGSRESSPFSTPQRHQHRLSRSVFSPGASSLMGASMALTSSVASYNGSPARSGPNGTPRKKLSGYSDDEKKHIRGRLEKRSAAIAKLRDSVEKAGPNVWRMTDED